MKFQICSDLHLEFAANRDWLKNNPIKPKADTLIIAGDTFYLDQDYSKLDFVKKISDDFKAVYLIPGNHEFYNGFDLSLADNYYKRKIKENVIMLNNTAIDLEGVKLIFSTMWSELIDNLKEIQRKSADFNQITYNKKPLNIRGYNQIHKKNMDFIESELRKDGEKILITHHLPSSQCLIDDFKDSNINDLFRINRDDLIETNHHIKAWVYGHSHQNKPDFKINNTVMITNQLGYFRDARFVRIAGCGPRAASRA